MATTVAVTVTVIDDGDGGGGGDSLAAEEEGKGWRDGEGVIRGGTDSAEVKRRRLPARPRPESVRLPQCRRAKVSR